MNAREGAKEDLGGCEAYDLRSTQLGCAEINSVPLHAPAMRWKSSRAYQGGIRQRSRCVPNRFKDLIITYPCPLHHVVANLPIGSRMTLPRR